jgi:hypothetical protein
MLSFTSFYLQVSTYIPIIISILQMFSPSSSMLPHYSEAFFLWKVVTSNPYVKTLSTI